MAQTLRSQHLAGWMLGLLLLACLVAVATYDGSPTRALQIATVVTFAVAFGYAAVHVRPAYLLCGAVAASCFSGNWGLLGLPGSFAPDRLLLAATLAMLVVRSRGASDRPRFALRLPHLLLLLVSLYAITSAVWADTLMDRAALFRMVDRFGLIPFLAFAIAPLAITTRRDRQALIGTLAALGAYLSLTALFETIDLGALVFPRFIMDPNAGQHFGRARGPFLEAQAMGMALFACAVACCIGRQYWAGRRARVLLAAVTVLCLAGTFFTLQRAVWIGVVAGSVIALLTIPRMHRWIIPAAAFGTALVVVLLTVVPGLADNVRERTGSQAQRSVWDRENLNAAAIRVVVAYPLFGVGWEKWQDRAEPYFRTNEGYPLTGSVDGRIQVVHNTYLAVASELGLLGAGLWLAALAVVFGGALMRRGPPDHAAWRAGLIALGVMWLTVMAFTPMEKPFTTMLMFVLAGVVYGSGWPRSVGGDELPALAGVAR